MPVDKVGCKTERKTSVCIFQIVKKKNLKKTKKNRSFLVEVNDNLSNDNFSKIRSFEFKYFIFCCFSFYFLIYFFLSLRNEDIEIFIFVFSCCKRVSFLIIALQIFSKVHRVVCSEHFSYVSFKNTSIFLRY